MGAAALYNFSSNSYGGLGLQNFATTGIISGFASGVTTYMVLGYKADISNDMDWNVEYNNFSGIAFGVSFKF